MMSFETTILARATNGDEALFGIAVEGRVRSHAKIFLEELYYLLPQEYILYQSSGTRQRCYCAIGTACAALPSGL